MRGDTGIHIKFLINEEGMLCCGHGIGHYFARLPGLWICLTHPYGRGRNATRSGIPSGVKYPTRREGEGRSGVGSGDLTKDGVKVGGM